MNATAAENYIEAHGRAIVGKDNEVHCSRYLQKRLCSDSG